MFLKSGSAMENANHKKLVFVVLLFYPEGHLAQRNAEKTEDPLAMRMVKKKQNIHK